MIHKIELEVTKCQPLLLGRTNTLYGSTSEHRFRVNDLVDIVPISVESHDRVEHPITYQTFSISDIAYEDSKAKLILKTF